MQFEPASSTTSYPSPQISRRASQTGSLRRSNSLFTQPIIAQGENDVVLDKSTSSSKRPISIIDDALFNSVTSASSLFDKRRSSSSLYALAASGSVGGVVALGGDRDSVGTSASTLVPLSTGRSSASSSSAVASRSDAPLNSFRSAGETIAENASAEWSPHRDSVDVFARRESPTRTRSRIPVSSVGHARALAEDNGSFDTSMTYDIEPGDVSHLSIRTSLFPGSPNASFTHSPNSSRRSLMITGGTGRVLSDLQAGVEHAKKALENSKSQLRASQRTVAQLTRQTEDLKEGRDRLRLENEGLNNVVARKERLLQEVLERARKAEAEATALKTTLKSTSAETKKSLRDMETTVVEATTTSHKAEREYITLKDSVQGMLEGWQKEIRGIRDLMKAKDEEWATEREQLAIKYKSVLKLQQASNAERARLEAIKAEKRENDAAFEAYFKEELLDLRSKFGENRAQTSKAEITADYVAGELGRIQQLMRQSGGRSLGVGSGFDLSS